jgi:hypothetical protein
MAQFIVILVIVIIIVLALRKKKEGSESSEPALYERLLRKTMSNKEQAERLIELERKKTPTASRARLVRNAIERWQRDDR